MAVARWRSGLALYKSLSWFLRFPEIVCNRKVSAGGITEPDQGTLRRFLDADYGMVLQAKKHLLAWKLPLGDLLRWRFVGCLGAVGKDKVECLGTSLQRYLQLNPATVLVTGSLECDFADLLRPSDYPAKPVAIPPIPVILSSILRLWPSPSIRSSRTRLAFRVLQTTRTG